MLVADTSAILHALLAQTSDPALIDRLGSEQTLHAPHLVDVEMLHAVRGLVRRRDLSEDMAAWTLDRYDELAIGRYPHGPLMELAWSWRADLTAYDAMFVALSSVLSAPLVTCDKRLAKSIRQFTEVEVEVYG